ncbi:hypothetical protein OKW34_000492 [Paraburkholderia youngii]
MVPCRARHRSGSPRLAACVAFNGMLKKAAPVTILHTEIRRLRGGSRRGRNRCSRIRRDRPPPGSTDDQAHVADFGVYRTRLRRNGAAGPDQHLYRERRRRPPRAARSEPLRGEGHDAHGTGHISGLCRDRGPAGRARRAVLAGIPETGCPCDLQLPLRAGRGRVRRRALSLLAASGRGSDPGCRTAAAALAQQRRLPGLVSAKESAQRLARGYPDRAQRRIRVDRSPVICRCDGSSGKGDRDDQHGVKFDRCTVVRRGPRRDAPCMEAGGARR